MTDYTKATNFATKDALVTGDPLKVVKGTEIDDEFNAIEDSIETKADLASPTFTGVPKAPTAAAGTNTTQLATTAFVQTQIDTDIAAIDLTNSIGADEIIDNSVGADELNVSGDGVAGQFLISDGDGSFSWTAISVLSPAASDPTTRDDGTALAEGDQYYNTAENKIKTYDGSAWAEAASRGSAGALIATKSTSSATFTEILNTSSTGTTTHTVTSEGYYFVATESHGINTWARITFDSPRWFTYFTTNTGTASDQPTISEKVPFTYNTFTSDPTGVTYAPSSWAFKHNHILELQGIQLGDNSASCPQLFILCYCEVGDTISLYNNSTLSTYRGKAIYKFDF